MKSLDDVLRQPLIFSRLFPFHIAVDANMKIAACGESLKVLFENSCVEWHVSSQFDELFLISSPSNIVLFENMDSLQSKLVELTFKPNGLIFQGQFILNENPRLAIFCGSPSLKHVEKIASLSLNASHFALHDMTLTHASLLQVYKVQMHELKMLNTRLKKSNSDNKKLHEETYRQANYDSLTGLPNRRFFYRTLKDYINHCDNGKVLGLCVIDLDDFKSVNDLLGHSIGDLYLKGVAQRITRYLSRSDFLARIGGDEFAVIFIDKNTESDIRSLMNHVLHEIKQSIYLGDVNWNPSASVGLEFMSDGMSETTLLRHADEAMYEAKSQGKGRIVFYDSTLSALSQQKAYVQANLLNAINSNELIAFFQPIVCLNTGKVVAIEALARWCRPDCNVIYPIDFIPYAEGTDLSVKLGEAILDYSVSCLSMLLDNPQNKDLCVSINISARQLYGNMLIENIRHVTHKYAVHPRSIILEITESSLLVDGVHVLQVLNSLKALEIKIAMDDFGTGYSSLSYLSNYPFDILKIDKSFLTGIYEKDVNRKVFSSVVHMAQALDLKVIAEGIESVSEKRILDQTGVGLAQGYYYSKPLPIKDLCSYLETSLPIRDVLDKELSIKRVNLKR